MAGELNIPGLGALSEHVALAPGVDAAKLSLPDAEARVVAAIGRAREIGEIITAVDQDSNLTIAALLALRAKGVIVKARVTKSQEFRVDTAMLEEVELDAARKKEVLELEARLATANAFELLGLPPGADPAAAKAAFFDLSRKFHPDRYFGKNLGSFKGRIERIFKRLSDAHQTLTNEQKRKAYLDAHPQLARPPVAEPAKSEPAPAPPSPPEAPPDPRRDDERRERLRKHPYLARHARVNDLLQRAKAAMARGDFASAHIDLVTASQADDRNTEIKSMIVDVKRKADAQRSAAEFDKAAKQEQAGDMQAALSSYRTASNLDNNNAEAAYAVARLMFRFNLEPKETTTFAQRAVEANPRHVEAHLLLGKLYEGADMKQMSKRHYEQAHRLAPDNPEAKKAVKGRWPF